MMASVICKAHHRGRDQELRRRRGYHQGPIPVLSPPPRAKIMMRSAICIRCFNSVANKASPWAELDAASVPPTITTGGTPRTSPLPHKGIEINRICDVYLDDKAIAEKEKEGGRLGGCDSNDQVWERCPTCGKLKKVANSSPNSSFETIPEED